MSRQEKKLAELRPLLEKQKEVIQGISKKAERAKEKLSKISNALAQKDSSLKYQLKSEGAAQSSIFVNIPSTKHIHERVATLRSERKTSSTLTMIAKKLRSQHTAAVKEYDTINKVLSEERIIFDKLNLEFKKLESSILMSVKRREQRRQNKQKKQQG